MAWAYLVETGDCLHDPANLEAGLWRSQAIWGLHAWANGSGTDPMQHDEHANFLPDSSYKTGMKTSHLCNYHR